MRLEKKAKIRSYELIGNWQLNLKAISELDGIILTESEITFYQKQLEKYNIDPQKIAQKNLIIDLKEVEKRDKESFYVEFYKKEQHVIGMHERTSLTYHVGDFKNFDDEEKDPRYRLKLPLTKKEFEELKKIPPGNYLKPNFRIE